MESNNILTIKDLLDFLNAKVEKNPKVLNYQLARYDYDDFAVGFTGFTFGIKRINIIKLPKEKDMDAVSSELTTKKILMIG